MNEAARMIGGAKLRGRSLGDANGRDARKARRREPLGATVETAIKLQPTSPL
jgi:hypothetical protein